MALTKAGCTVTAVCPSAHPVARTRAVQQIYIYNGFAPLKTLADAVIAAEPDFVLPCDDLATQQLYALYRNSRKRGNGGESICALLEHSFGSPECLPTAYARTAFMETAMSEGIRVPTTNVIHKPEELEKCVSRMGLPLVLKADGTTGGLGVKVVRGIKDAERAFRALQAPPSIARVIKRAVMDRDYALLWPLLLCRRSVVNAQAFVAGHEATSSIVCWKGEVLASLHFEVLNKTDAAGHATVLRSIENTEMAEATEKVARRLNLSGVHGFDFILEAGTGNAYLIEMNPRATQVGHLTLGPGRDLPAALYAALSGGVIQSAPKLTESDTIALFPHEWLRNPQSSFLQSGYHDVPWDEPQLVRACIASHPKRRGWYSARSQNDLSTSSNRFAWSKSGTQKD